MQILHLFTLILLPAIILCGSCSKFTLINGKMTLEWTSDSSLQTKTLLLAGGMSSARMDNITAKEIRSNVSLVGTATVNCTFLKDTRWFCISTGPNFTHTIDNYLFDGSVCNYSIFCEDKNKQVTFSTQNTQMGITNGGRPYEIHVTYQKEIPAQLLYQQIKVLLAIYSGLLNRTLTNAAYDQNGVAVTPSRRFLQIQESNFIYVSYFYPDYSISNDALADSIENSLLNRTNLLELYQNKSSQMNISLPTVTDINGAPFVIGGQLSNLTYNTTIDCYIVYHIGVDLVQLKLTLANGNGLILVGITNETKTNVTLEIMKESTDFFLNTSRQFAVANIDRFFNFSGLNPNSRYIVYYAAIQEGLPPLRNDTPIYNFNFSTYPEGSQSLERMLVGWVICLGALLTLIVN